MNNSGGGNYVKLTNTIMVSPKFEYTHGPLVVDGSGTYSHSKNDYEALTRGTIRAEVINPVVADFRATRPSSDSAEWTITQLAGPDWSRLENYTNARIAGETDRDVRVETYQAQLNATYALPWSTPTTFKVGGKINEELRESANRISFWQYNYVGPGGGPTGNLAAFPIARAARHRLWSHYRAEAFEPGAVREPHGIVGGVSRASRSGLCSRVPPSSTTRRNMERCGISGRLCPRRMRWPTRGLAVCSFKEVCVGNERKLNRKSSIR